jgi:hypothetical protein
MRKPFVINLFIILSLVLGISWINDYQTQAAYLKVQDTNDSSQTTEIIPLEIVQEMIGQVDQERILSDLRRLTGVDQICTHAGCYTITDRDTGSVGLQWAKEYFYEELVNLGYTIELQDWSMDGYSDQNLIVRKLGRIKPEEEIYFVAHLDGVPLSSAADDNASGAVSLLELARIIKNRYLGYSVVMIFSTGEEHGALGVWSYVNHLTPPELNAIRYAVDIDMIGYDSNDDGAMQLWSGDQPLDLAQKLSEIIDAYQIGLTARIVPGCD